MDVDRNDVKDLVIPRRPMPAVVEDHALCWTVEAPRVKVALDVR